MFSNLTVGKKMSGLIALSALTLTVLGAVSYWNTGKLVQTASWVAHTHEVLEANEKVLSALKDSEAGQRGFLITGEDRYLEPYNKSIESSRTAIQELRRLLRV